MQTNRKDRKSWNTDKQKRQEKQLEYIQRIQAKKTEKKQLELR